MINFRAGLVISAMVLLAGCESDEERAEQHFESGVELFEAGDVDRAVVEFRNVLRLDANHKDARLLFARISMDRDNTGDAYRSYLRVVEQHPEVLEGRIALAEIAAFTQSWEEAERHGRAALELAPDDLDVQVVNAVLDYRQALLDRDDAARAEIVSRAEALVLERPDSVILRNILVDGRNWLGDLDGALEQVDAAIALEPEYKPLHFSKLSILGATGDEPAIEAHLRDMAARFPGDEDIEASLIRFLVQTGDMEKAEAFFRDIADPDGPEIGPYAAFVRFISETRGEEAAIAELDTTAETSVHSAVLRAMRAGLRFDIGEQEAAIREMEEVLAGDPPLQIAGNLRVALAQMLVTTGNEVGARRRVEEALDADPGNIEAQKMEAGWLIEADRTDEAVTLLRGALEQVPGDVEAMLILSQAYGRAGSHELGRDMLALAVATSDNAPGPTLRYASALIDEGRLRPAESILVDALRNAPENVDLLATLGRVYLLEQDVSRGRGVVNRLRTLGTDDADEVAERLELGLLAAEQRTEELVANLESLSRDGEAGARARGLLIQARIADGDLEGAVKVAREAHESAPGDSAAQITLAVTLAATGDFDGAVAEYRAMIEAGRADGRVHRLLTATLQRKGDEAAAAAALAAGLEAFPLDPEMLWMRASLLERDGDIEGAIAVYETLYQMDSGALVVANNLASLLATWRSDDAESIERAYAIARRLRGTDVPAFQDTYGWILHLRGESEEALDYLGSAAAGLPADAIVQYHLGMALVAAGREAEAAEQLRLAIDIAGAGDARPQFESARAELDRLSPSVAPDTLREN